MQKDRKNQSKVRAKKKELVSLTNTPLLWIVNDNNISLSNMPIGKKVFKISSKTIYDISVDQVKKILFKKNLV